jgi:hypothetical protein
VSSGVLSGINSKFGDSLDRDGDWTSQGHGLKLTKPCQDLCVYVGGGDWVLNSGLSACSTT